MNSQYSISVIIPTYNYGHLIQRTLDSVIPQLGDNDEVIVVDDGSTDNTQDVLAQALVQNPDKNIRVLSKQNGGVASARNLGIRKATGRYLVFLDADDIYQRDALKTLKQTIKASPESEVVLGGHISHNESQSKSKTYAIANLSPSKKQRLKDLLIHKTIRIGNLGACLIDKSVFKRGVFPEKFRVGEDLPIFAQLMTATHIALTDYPLVKIFKHAESLRHQHAFNKQSGTEIVEEIFSQNRLGQEFSSLKSLFLSQRYLSLFRSAYRHMDWADAREYYAKAIKQRPINIFKLSYTKKAVGLLLK
jgi:glycosyltransferase involved in cell wall biosynthesis